MKFDKKWLKIPILGFFPNDIFPTFILLFKVALNLLKTSLVANILLFFDQIQDDYLNPYFTTNLVKTLLRRRVGVFDENLLNYQVVTISVVWGGLIWIALHHIILYVVPIKNLSKSVLSLFGAPAFLFLLTRMVLTSLNRNITSSQSPMSGWMWLAASASVVFAAIPGTLLWRRHFRKK